MKKFNLKFPKGTGIMFHHFHDNKKNLKSQGSISKNELIKIIKFLGLKNILNADKFLLKYNKNILKKGQFCLTFDDGIKSQLNIAVPVLNKFNIKGFFFVNSGSLNKKDTKLEVYRYIRNNVFKDVEKFYKVFFELLNPRFKKIISNPIIMNDKHMNKKLFPYYTENDIRFRVLRDNYLTKHEYDKIMLKVIKNKKINVNKIYRKVYLNKSDLKKLHSEGHVIGLHSHSHPDKIELLSKRKKEDEYKKNIYYFSKLLNINRKEIFSVSHPNGSFDLDILRFLNKSGILLGFMQVTKNYHKLSIKNKKKFNQLILPREDHINILNFIKNEKQSAKTNKKFF